MCVPMFLCFSLLFWVLHNLDNSLLQLKRKQRYQCIVPNSCIVKINSFITELVPNSLAA